ncbi:MAG: hypothetical protein ACTSWY_01420 [Promethearchaeota archaeon]
MKNEKVKIPNLSFRIIKESNFYPNKAQSIRNIYESLFKNKISFSMEITNNGYLLFLEKYEDLLTLLKLSNEMLNNFSGKYFSDNIENGEIWYVYLEKNSTNVTNKQIYDRIREIFTLERFKGFKLNPIKKKSGKNGAKSVLIGLKVILTFEGNIFDKFLNYYKEIRKQN